MAEEEEEERSWENMKKSCDWWCEDEASKRSESELGATIRQTILFTHQNFTDK